MPCANLDVLVSFFFRGVGDGILSAVPLSPHPLAFACFREDRTHARSMPGSLPSGPSFC